MERSDCYGKKVLKMTYRPCIIPNVSNKYIINTKLSLTQRSKTELNVHKLKSGNV